MKKYLLLALCLSMVGILVLAGCAESPAAQPDTEPVNGTSYDDGRYRGIFADGGDIQVGVQFDLQNNTISNLSFRQLYYGGVDYRDIEEDHAFYPITTQYEQIVDYYDSKPLEAIYDLHNPGDFIDDVDGFTGATIRGNKVLSAVTDALNRGAYVPANGVTRAVRDYDDGRYRGIFADGGDIQVGVQFDLQNNTISNLSFRQLYYGGVDYRDIEEDHAFYPIATQHGQILDYYEGKPLESIYDLHNPGDFIDDIDGFTGASIRGNKVLSAIVDALNRGVYVPANGVTRAVPDYEDGRYRGIFADGGDIQVAVQFDLQDNTISNLSFRQLYYGGVDYRDIEEDHAFYPIATQHGQILDYYEGKPLESIYDLHNPGDFIDDLDGFTGASIRGNKVLSAIVDALNRGVYQYRS